MRGFNVCDGCSVALTNDDYSAIDGDLVIEGDTQEEYDARMASVYASVEAMGNVVDSGRTSPGYADCFVCDEATLSAKVWVSV